MGDYEQRIQSGVGIGADIPLNGDQPEFQLTVFPLESGWGGKKRASLFNRVSPEYRLTLGNGEKKHFFGFRFGLGKLKHSDLTSYGIDARIGVTEDLAPLVGIELHFSDSVRQGVPGFFLGIEKDLGDGGATAITTGLRWAIAW